MVKILICPPQFFEIDYEINPWMHKSNPVDHDLARTQWEKLKSVYSELGVDVEVVDPVPGWPDMVFTANAGLVVAPKKFLLAKFLYPERQGEEPYFRKWFEKHGWEVLQTKAPFEGQGEGFIWNDQLLVGFGQRATEDVIPELTKLTGLATVSLKLIYPKFYHLDMALAPINKDLIIYNPKAFDAPSVAKIKSLGAELIEVSEEDAEIFGCNLVPVANTIIMIEGTRKLASDFKSHGFETIELDMSEFRKSGGAIRCLTLDLD